MPRIDPLKLLSCVKVLLASNGGIRGTNEVKRLAGLMAKYSKKLVSKCIYIQILKCTNTDLLDQFMAAGGWGLAYMWLADAIRATNWPLVQEILELLLLCPVDVQRLRSNTAPKLVKGLCKDGGLEAVRILASRLVEQWLKLVKSESGVDQNKTVAGATVTKVEGGPVTFNKGAVIKLESGVGSGTIFVNNMASETHLEEDPLAIPSVPDENVNDFEKASVLKSGDPALVYKIVYKGGKQVFAKVENSSASSSETKVSASEPKTTDVPASETASDNEVVKPKPAEEGAKSSDKISNKENEKQTDKIDSKESKDRDREKEPSRSSSKDKEKEKEKDKERSRDKHSSSSHKSSSKSSSSSKTKSEKSSSEKSSSSTSSSSKKSHRNSTDSSSSSSKSKDKEESKRDADRNLEKDKHKSSSSKKSSSSSSSSSSKHKDRDKSHSSSNKERSKDKEREKEKDREKEKESQAEKDKDTLSKISPPSIDKLGKIPKKPKEDTSDDSKKSEAQPSSITIPSKKASISIEFRKDAESRPKTVKTYNSQFRSHGLAEEAPPPPSRKGLKKPPSQPLPGTSIPPTLSFKRAASPPPIQSPVSSAAKDTPPDKKSKIDMTNSSNVAEKPGAIKLIAPKPKPQTLVESDMFMDALYASAHVKKDAKKRKRRPSASKDSGKDGSSPPESPVTSSPKATPLKFYQDTLEDKDDSRVDISDDDKNEDEDDIPLKRMKDEIEGKGKQDDEDKSQDRKSEDDSDVVEVRDENVKKPPGPGCGPDGPPGVLVLHKRKGPKKKLKWRAQEELEEVRFFELDETERVNVTKTFTDMKQMERFNEREAFLMARKLNCEDIMTEQTQWTALILVEDVPPHPEGNQSKEKKIQAEREQTTLKALYFTRQMIPDAPAEPDMEQYQITEPAVIPMDDVTGNQDAINDFTSMPWPDPKGSPPYNMPDDFSRVRDGPFPGGQFNPFVSFGPGPWPPMGGPGNGPPNGMPPPNIVGPMGGGFNNMNMCPPNMPMNPEDMGMNPMNNMNPMGNINPMNSIGIPMGNPMPMGNMNNMPPPPFGPPGPGPGGPPPMFGGPPNNPNFNNFGPPPPNMNMPPNMGGMGNMNNNGPPARGNPGGGRGGWRSGGPPPPMNNNQSGGNWRSQGSNQPGSRNWVHGNSNGRICKQFQRGYCRNGNKCSYMHVPGNKGHF